MIERAHGVEGVRGADGAGGDGGRVSVAVASEWPREMRTPRAVACAASSTRRATRAPAS